MEEYLQIVVGGTNSGTIEGGRGMRFPNRKISDRIQLRPSGSLLRLWLEESTPKKLKGEEQ